MAEWYFRACNPSDSLWRNPQHDIARLATPHRAAITCEVVPPDADMRTTLALAAPGLDGKPWREVVG